MTAAGTARGSDQLGDGHLWLHFTRTSDWMGPEPSIPVIDHGAGCYVWDTAGNRYLDGLSALFCVQTGYGRREMVDAAAGQMASCPSRPTGRRRTRLDTRRTAPTRARPAGRPRTTTT